MATVIKLKRAYEPANPDDGFRIYIDRLWPQGLSHETFKYDLWDKEVSPSTELREWFHANPAERWIEFEKRYMIELKSNPAFMELKKIVDSKDIVTLLFSSKDTVHNNAVILKSALES